MIAVSDALGALAGELGARRDRVCVIPNGVDPSAFQRGDRAAARARLGLPPQRPILLSVGAFIARKGHARLVRSLPALIAQRPDLLLVAVGNRGDTRSQLPAIQRLVRRLRLADHVQLVVGRPHEEIPWWLQAADLFCLATEREGWSNALSEALACGLPVVTTRVGGNPDIVREGVDGYLIPYYDADAFAAAIVRALDAPWDRGAIAARAARRTWEDVADEVMQVFRAALEESAGRSPSVR